VSSGAQAGDLGYVSRDGTVRVLPVSDRVPAPTVRGESLDGGSVDVRDLVGQVVVVNFWASWCGPCRTEQPRLNTAFAATRSKGVAFVGIDYRDDDAQARAFRRTHDVGYPSITDYAGTLMLDFKVPGQPPSTVVIDRHGRTAAKIIGQTPKGVLEPIIDQLAAESSA
jgi:thiol-disulfide isomerase/thioredoxin